MRELFSLLFISLIFSLPTLAQKKKKNAMADVSPIAQEKYYDAVQWRHIGPFRGGRSCTVTGVPNQPNLYYMGATGGGVWRTKNGGQNWDNISDGYFGGSIGAIAVSESDPNVIFAGGGEQTLRGNASSGYGIWKSEDAGGNAFDAAIAAYAAACIAEPCMASAGAGALAHIYAVGQKPYVLDFFCQTPASNKVSGELDFFEIPVDFGDAQEVYFGGLAAMAVPGAVAGLFAIHEQLATRPMRVLLEQAIDLAKQGVAINNFQHYDLSLLHNIFDHQPRAKELFKPEGTLIDVGHVLKLPAFADFLDYLAGEGPQAFYQGEVAQKLADDCASKGGFLSRADMANYQVIRREPLKTNYADHKVFTNPLPAIGGAQMTVGLDTLEAQSGELAKRLL